MTTPKREWKTSVVAGGLFFVTVFTAMGTNSAVGSLRDDVAELRRDVRELNEIRAEIEDLARARNDILRAIRRVERRR